MKLIVENANDRDIVLLPVAIHYIEESIETDTPISGFISLGEDKHEVYVSIRKNKKSFRILFHHQ